MARGLISVATELSGRAPAGRDIAIPSDTGVERAFKQVANDIGGISARIGEMADRAASQEGSNDGRQAGLDPEFRTRQDGTIRGEAFDKAGLQVAEARLKSVLDGELQKAYDKHGSSPARLAQALDAAGAGVLSGAPEELAPKLQINFGSQRLAFMREADRAQTARVRAEQQGALVSDLARAEREAHQSGFALGLDAEADKAVAGNRSLYASVLSRVGVDGKRLIDPATAAELLTKYDVSVTNGRLIGAMDRLRTPEEKSKFIRELEADFAGSRGVAKVYKFEQFEAIRGRLETDLRRSLNEEQQTAKIVVNAIESIRKRAEKGVPPPAEELAQIKAVAAASGDPAAVAAIADAEHQLEWQRTFRTLPISQMQDTVAEMRRREQVDGATPRQIARRESAERLLSNAQSELKSNPLAWDDKVGAIKLQPLNPTSSETLIGSGQVRVVQAEQAAARHGLAKPIYLQPHEARSLSKAFAAGGDQGLQVAEAITQAFGSRAPAVFEEIGKSGPAVARLGQLMIDQGRSKGVVDAAEGLHLVGIPGYKRMAPERSKTREIIMSETRGALAGFEDQISSAATVADLIYEKRAYAARATTFDDRLWRQAFREALGEHKVDGKVYGGIVDQGFWNKNPVVIPSFVRQNGWSEVVGMIEPSDLAATRLGKPTGRSGKEIDMARIKAGRLIPVGDGQYAVSLSGGAQPDVSRDGRSNQPFIIDIRELAPRLRRRRPDLFHGGEE